MDSSLGLAPFNSPSLPVCICVAGQLVYTSGFPHFTSLGRLDNFLPSIFEGRITKVTHGVIFTDASVQSGQSGGPIFSQRGNLIGVCISNSKDDNNRLIYPNINMAVPVYDIYPILQKYDQTKGKLSSRGCMTRSVHHADCGLRAIWTFFQMPDAYNVWWQTRRLNKHGHCIHRNYWAKCRQAVGKPSTTTSTDDGCMR